MVLDFPIYDGELPQNAMHRELKRIHAIALSCIVDIGSNASIAMSIITCNCLERVISSGSLKFENC